MIRKKKLLKGSLTIEATIIVPLILILIITMIYISFYLYNRCIIAQNSYITALRGSLYKEDVSAPEYDRNNYMKRENSSLNGKKLIGVKNYHFKCMIQDKSIIIDTRASIKVPFALLSKNGFQNEWVIREQKKSKIIKEIDIIRNYRKMQRLVKGKV